MKYNYSQRKGNRSINNACVDPEKAVDTNRVVGRASKYLFLVPFSLFALFALFFHFQLLAYQTPPKYFLDLYCGILQALQYNNMMSHFFELCLVLPRSFFAPQPSLLPELSLPRRFLIVLHPAKRV